MNLKSWKERMPRKKKIAPKVNPKPRRKSWPEPGTKPKGLVKPKGYKSPDDVWQAFLDYREFVKSNPRKRQDYVGKDGTLVYRDIERPLIIEGFKSWCYEFRTDVHHYFDNTDNRYNEYRETITRIKEFIRNEQIDGALTGDYNSNLTARLNGIVDKQEISASHNVKVINIDPLADGE